MSVHIREKRGKLYLDVYNAGKRSWRKTGLTLSSDMVQRKESLRLAEILRSKLEHQLVAQENGLQDPIGSRATLLDYARELYERHPTKNLKYAITHLERYDPTIRLGAIDERWLEAFRDWLLRDSGLGQGSASLYFTQTVMVLHRAVRDRLLTRDPSLGLRGIKQPESIRQPLTAEEVARLAASPLESETGREVSRGFLFACHVGLRISDLAALTWTDVDRGPPPRIFIRVKKTGGALGLPLSSSAWKLIDDGRIHHGDEKIFPRIRPTSMSWHFETWARQVGLEKFLGWHQARRTFATIALAKGASIYTIQKMLGHASPAMTQIYAKIGDELTRAAVDSLPEVNLPKERAGS